MKMRRLIAFLGIIFMCGCVSARKSRGVIENMSFPSTTRKPVVSADGEWIPARVQKIWIAPHVDPEAGDFVQGHYKYVIIKPGHWKAQEESIGCGKEEV